MISSPPQIWGGVLFALSLIYSHLLFFFDSKKVFLKRSENINEIVDISIVVNCAPIAKEISDRLFSQNNISPQAELLFPPAAIGKRG